MASYGRAARSLRAIHGHNSLQPLNATTSLENRGVNVLMLWAAAAITGCQGSRWGLGRGSFKQWQQISAQVRQGEKETPVVCDKPLPRHGGGGAGGPISGQFEGAAAASTQSNTYLLAKIRSIFIGTSMAVIGPSTRQVTTACSCRRRSSSATGRVTKRRCTI